IDDIAGMPNDRPLTFGDLWQGRLSVPADDDKRPKFPVVNLEMVTTCVSHGRPYTFPGEQSVLYFRAIDLRPFLPSYVVDHLKSHSPDSHGFTKNGLISDHDVMRLPIAR